MLAHVINSLLCLSQLCHRLLLDIKLFFFWGMFLLGSPISESVELPPCCKVVFFLIVRVGVNIMSSVLLLLIYLPPSAGM